MKRLFFVLLLVVCAARADSPGSIYNLHISLTDARGTRHGLDVHRGHPVLITMFYGNCPMACPLLIDTMRSVERSASAADRDRVRFLLISIDPERDTAESLRKLSVSRKLDASRWTMARTDAIGVRKIAALLGIQYRKLPDGSFNHSSVITLVTPDGEIAAQSSLMGQADPKLLEALVNISNGQRKVGDTE
ncbi:SCO family protein [Peristeroidobacter agariperforans]|uniref:SCO family protein n=1 Tax=Peristeroidobacter agariperforans TaxID=268404 RepID=UPI00101B6CC4|nr:SCO family protein [Peristeroidobacter agariperforans]